MAEVKQGEHGVPLGDFVYNWLLLKLNNELLVMRDILNAQDYEMIHNHHIDAESMFQEMDEFLKGNTNESE